MYKDIKRCMSECKSPKENTFIENKDHIQKKPTYYLTIKMIQNLKYEI